jgi:thiamine transport system permease protein
VVLAVTRRRAAEVRLPRWVRWVAVAVPSAFLAVFFVWPVAAIVGRGLRPEGRWALAAVGAALTDGSLRRVAWFTLWQAVASTVLTVLVALPAAYCFARLSFAGKRILWASLIVPFVLPTIVVGAAFLALVGADSPLGLDLRGSVWAILLAHVFFNYAVVVRTVGGLWSRLDPALEDAARVLGASRWRAFRDVTLPLLRPAVAAASSIVFLFTLTSFGVVLLLGGPARRTLEVEIYTRTVRLLDLDTAAVLALVQLVFVTVVLVWYARYQERRALPVPMRPEVEVARRPTTAGERGFLVANLAVMAVLLGAPIAVLVARAFDEGRGWGTGNFAALGSSRRGSVLFVPPLEAVRNSLVFALAATAIALVVGGLAAVAITAGRDGARRGRAVGLLDVALMLPLATSAATVGFGFLIALDEPPLDLRDSPALVPIAHALVAVPFVVRTMVPVLRAVDPRLREAAAVLGAGPGRVWRTVDGPIVARAVAVAAGFAFAVSLGEFGATVFLARADWPTLPLAIYRFLGQPGATNVGQAMALATVLMVLTVVVVLAVDRVRVGRLGEF